MPIKLKGGPRDGETVPATVAKIGDEFTLKHYPPTDPKLSPREAIRAAVTLTYKRTSKTTAEYVGSLPSPGSPG